MRGMRSQASIDNETVTRVGSGLLAPSWAHVMGPVAVAPHALKESAAAKVQLPYGSACHSNSRGPMTTVLPACAPAFSNAAVMPMRSSRCWK